MSKPPKFRIPKGFFQTVRKARSLVKNLDKTKTVLSDAEEKAGRSADRIKAVKNDLQNLFRLISCWIKGDYKKVPLQSIIMAMAGVLYFLNPFDAVHDYLPLAGYIDDVAFLSFIIRSIKQDIEEFLIWEKHT